MFVDSEDYEHLINQLKKDLPVLQNKLVAMRTKIEKQLKKGNYFQPLLRFLEWRNHVTNVKWTIYYTIHKKEGLLIIRLFPITAYNNKEGKKDYFVFCLDAFNQKLAESHLFKVFKGHFISRYLSRTHRTDLTPYTVIIHFMVIQDIGINYHYHQNGKWLMYLNTLGIAMIREDRLCLIFDTFLTFQELKPDQNLAILEFVDELLVHQPKDFCFIFLHLLQGNGQGWDKFFTEAKIIRALQSVEKNNPIFARMLKQEIAKFIK